MGNAWNIKSASEVLLKTLLAAMRGSNAFDFQKCVVHRCSDKCPQVETLAQARQKDREAKKQQMDKMGIIEV